MRPLQPVQIEAMDPRRFEPVISIEEYQDLLALIDRAAAALQGRVIWNVNSTGTGGGVAELLRTLLGYSRGGGIDARWLVLSGDAAFFEVTKRIHNRLHGFGGDGRDLNEAERAIYEGTLAENAARLVPLIHPEDVVILHDPQTAGLVDAVRGTGAAVVWRCHVGVDHPNARVHEAWSFMRRYVRGADAYVFSRAEYAWDGLDPRKVAAIHPSIDPFSAKNQDQTPAQTLGILMRAGIVSGGSPEQATFTYGDATPGRIDRAATLLEAKQLSPSDRFIVQVSRWDELKDPLGVMAGFSRHIADRTDVHLVLAGPAADSVADDPEGAAVRTRKGRVACASGRDPGPCPRGVATDDRESRVFCCQTRATSQRSAARLWTCWRTTNGRNGWASPHAPVSGANSWRHAISAATSP